MNIIDYVQNNLKTFKESAFKEVDALVLSQFCYIKLKGMVPEEGIKLKDLYNRSLFDRMFLSTRTPLLNRELLSSMASSSRYRECVIKYHKDIVNKELQFSATTFCFDDFVYVAFRGTDGTIVGWQEDFALSFMSPIPSQREAYNYLKMVVSKEDKDIYVGGHSKGGNLSIYASLKCSDCDKIKKIFSNDGPGFPESITDSEEYKKIEDKIYKTIPTSSFIGLLLDTSNHYRIIKSNKTGIMQHDPFSWVVKNNSFVYVDKLSSDAVFASRVINRWLSNMDNKKRALFVDTLFDIFNSSNEDTFGDISRNFMKTVPMMIKASQNLDKKTKEEFNNLILELAKAPFMGEK